MYFLFGPFITLEVDTSANVNYGKESCKRFNVVTKSLNSLLAPQVFVILPKENRTTNVIFLEILKETFEKVLGIISKFFPCD